MTRRTATAPGILGRRLDFGGAGAWSFRLWHLLALVIVLAAPAQVFLGQPLLVLPARAQAQAWVWGLTFLTTALSLSSAAAAGAAPSLLRAVIASAGMCGVAYGMIAFVLRVPASTTVAVMSATLVLVLSLLPGLIARHLVIGSTVLIGAAAFVVVPHLRAESAATDPVVTTALVRFTVTSYTQVVDSVEIPGGALAAMRDDFLLVTGEGEFYRLHWGAEDDRLESTRLPLTARFNRDLWRTVVHEIAAEIGGGLPLRTTDVAVDTSVEPVRVYLSHQYWNPEQRCLTARVSIADLPAPGAVDEEGGAWTTFFESWPCVPPSYELRRGGTGGRLAWAAPGTLLLSVADYGLAGADGLEGPQDPASAYGKIFRLDTRNGHEIVSLGHRNPQGLSVAVDGGIWSTEHGPQGGDEVNHIQAGANYGWPLATYGVQYGQDSWPLARGRVGHAGFAEPALAFVPSIGVSNLIEIPPMGFRAWEGDLLVASLREQALFRLRKRDDRIIYSERIPIGARIRDLEQGSDGRILLWIDDGRILVLAERQEQTRGEQAYAACAGCHGTTLEGTTLGPSLRGIEGRAVASQPGFPYSPALKNVGGRWTMERLEAFVESPQTFAEGTTMAFPGVPSPFFLLEYIRNYTPSGER